MAKCPKCLSRKGKRHCPALDGGICSQCCAEHRLVTISCPESCRHLSSEFYQRKRRHERAATHGRRFVEALKALFSTEPRRQFVFALQADIYYFMNRHGAVEDNVVAEVLQYMKGLRARIVVPESAPHALAGFLEVAMKNARRYPEDLADRDAEICLDNLTRHVHSLGGEESTHYRDEITAYFGALDFEADLDYDPEEVVGGSAAGPRRSGGGLILPP